jgi:hypothetical protein
MKVHELRARVDYSDNTPNEPRIYKCGEYTDDVYYPLGNMYPNPSPFRTELTRLPTTICGDENTNMSPDRFDDYLHMQQIQYAITHLQVAALRARITRNYTHPVLTNPFMLLMRTKYPVSQNLDAVRDIVKILVENYDDYLDMIARVPQTKENDILNGVLHAFLPEDPDNTCSICLSTHPRQYLIRACECKTPAHATCLIELNAHRELDTCMVCNHKYRMSKPIQRSMSGIIVRETTWRDVYFPFHDMYYEPLLSNSPLQTFEGMSRLTMAIMYLQVERVQELLRQPDIVAALPEYRFGYEGYKQNPLHVLCSGNMPTNAAMSFQDNTFKYLKLARTFADACPAWINESDAFGKTPKDYVEQSGTGLFMYAGIFS